MARDNGMKEVTAVGTETQAAIDAGVAIATARADARAQVHKIGGDGIPFRITDDDEIETLEAYLARPLSKAGSALLIDVDSFVAYVNDYKDPHSRLFANRLEASITAVLDFHERGAGAARHGNHRADLKLQYTKPWKTWIAANGKPAQQVEFMRFLEDNALDIADPDAAVIMELVSTLEATKTVRFKSSNRLHDGMQQLQYEEDITQGSAAGGAERNQTKVPEKFVLALSPYEGFPLYHVDARLRFRINEGRLSFWFDLVRPDLILEAAFADARKRVVDETGLPVHNGTAPPATA